MTYITLVYNCGILLSKHQNLLVYVIRLRIQVGFGGTILLAASCMTITVMKNTIQINSICEEERRAKLLSTENSPSSTIEAPTAHVCCTKCS